VIYVNFVFAETEKTGLRSAVWARSLALEKQEIDTRLRKSTSCAPTHAAEAWLSLVKARMKRANIGI